MKKKVAMIVVALLLMVLVGWRLWPHSFSAIISVDKKSISNIACQASVSGVENGDAFINAYTLNDVSPQDAGFKEIIAILDSSNYHQDFRNLLPWPVDSVGSGNTNKGMSANVALVWGTGENEYCFISFHSDSIMAVSLGTESRLQVYHPTNRVVLSFLAEYLQTHGNVV